ncbi:hypothetical protein, partial [Paeniglutamicibacter cryotolerans]|uniref:hypothetical protein n=1 Tax=Paeniglutamicibacter cryotolerans TaxID=670079 RepID=UPI0031E6E3FA
QSRGRVGVDHARLRTGGSQAPVPEITGPTFTSGEPNEFGTHAPRGGGRTRPADNEEAEWEEIDAEEAAESDQQAADAFTDIVKALDILEERNLELSIVAPDDLREAFEAIQHRVYEYLMGLDGMIKGSVLQQTMDDVEQLFKAAQKKSRQAVRSPQF